MYITTVHANTKASVHAIHTHTCTHTVDTVSSIFLFPCGSWLWPFRSLQMKRAWSVAEGPSINNKQQLSCVRPSVSRGTWSQASASERRLLLFPPLVLSLSMAYKSVDVCVRPRVCVCVHSTAQHRAPLYCILKLARSKKAELRVAGAGERGLPAHCRTAGSSPRSQLPRTG